MGEYEAMKAEISRLQDKVDLLTHDLKIARETITDTAKVRDDFFESLSAREARLREALEWVDKWADYQKYEPTWYEEVKDALRDTAQG